MAFNWVDLYSWNCIFTERKMKTVIIVLDLYRFWLFLLSLLSLCVCLLSVCLCVCVSCVCLFVFLSVFVCVCACLNIYMCILCVMCTICLQEPVEVRRRDQISLNWSDRWLCDIMRVLRADLLLCTSSNYS